MGSHKTNVLYIAGAGRSGSTIIGDILGSIDSFFHTGELYSVWDVTMQRDLFCGCGKPLNECEVWRPILEDVFPKSVELGSEHMAQLKTNIPRTHQAPFLLYKFQNGSGQTASLLDESAQEYTRVLSKLYRAIQNNTQCTWIVDSSKIPSQAFLLLTIPHVHLHILHLVRDPRAVAYSWRRRAIFGHQPSPRLTAMTWGARNFVLEIFRNFGEVGCSFLRYEDFVDNPRMCISKLLEDINYKSSPPPFTSSHEVHLGGNHTVWGNPKRTKQGSIEIYRDDEWKTEMNWTDKLTVEALTWPFLLRYGYLSNRRSAE